MAIYQGLLVFFCLVFLMVGCAKKPERGKRLPRRKETSVTKPLPPPPKVQEPLSPKREASQKMVRLGEGYLENGELDRAVQTFQEAINVDIENGVAYYFLAKALYQKGLHEDALGLLERAAALLEADSDWAKEVSYLKATIEEAKETTPPPPSGREVYY